MRINKKNLIKEINKELLAKRDLEYKEGVERYFKEKIYVIGVRTPEVRKIANSYFQEIKDLPKEEIFDLCERLLEIKTGEQKTIAFSWAYRIKNQYEKSDYKIFESWLKKYVSNWGHCDDFCTHAFGSLLHQFPELLPKVKSWTRSRSRWLRRASAVTMIYPVGKKEKRWPKEVFMIADRLLLDQDDLVQKGYGWMLKVAADVWQKEVFNYVMKNKHQMPRTALRYAIEKMPGSLKSQAMAK